MTNSLLRRFFFGLPAMAMILAAGCQKILVESGPHTIEFNEEAIAYKSQFLSDIHKATSTDTLPNVLLILVDDLGKYDNSAYDRNGVATPAINRLAKSGVTFTSAYSTSSVCSPSRASMLTGRYQQRFGFERQPMNRYPKTKLEYWFVDWFVNTSPMQLVNPMSSPKPNEIERQGIPPDEILLSEILEARGYRTGIFGKWHLGFHDPFLPNRRGFEQQFGFYEAFTQYASEKDPGIINYRHDYFANKHIWRQKRKGTCAIRENDLVIEDHDYLTFSIADRACRFIDQYSDAPFFLYVPFNAPHTPFQVPLTYYNRFSDEKDPNKRVYYGMIAALDDAVGRILKKLEEQDLMENTLVIFASDNGGAAYTGATDNGIQKGGKFTQFEGGINVPMMMSWKGVLPDGVSYVHMVSLMDIFTTVTSVAGCPLPADREMDGKNLIPYISFENTTSPHQFLCWRTDFNKAVRQDNWKLVWNERDDQVFLYNLELDPSEQDNLTIIYPEKTEDLKRLIIEWEKEMKEPLWPGVMQFRFDQKEETTWWAI